MAALNVAHPATTQTLGASSLFRGVQLANVDYLMGAPARRSHVTRGGARQDGQAHLAQATTGSAQAIAIGYTRRSKESGARTVSLADQAARIADYCEDQGWQLAEVVTDDGVSGGRRERLERLAGRVKATGARFVVVYHLDRFARDLAGTLDYLRRFSRHGVELHVVGRGRVEADSASGFIVTAVEGLAAEHYRRLISEKTRDALARLRAQGRRVSRFAPYGLALAPGGRLVPEPREQAVLSDIVALREAGLSLRAISMTLANRGLLARNGRPFAAQTLKRLAASCTVQRI